MFRFSQFDIILTIRLFHSDRKPLCFILFCFLKLFLFFTIILIYFPFSSKEYWENDDICVMKIPIYYPRSRLLATRNAARV